MTSRFEGNGSDDFYALLLSRRKLGQGITIPVLYFNKGI